MAWLSGYGKRRKLTLDSSVIDSDLTHFPVPVPLGTSVGLTGADVSSIFDEVGSDYLKIAVTTSDGETQLYVEVEQWDDTNEKALLWVSKSDWEIASASDTEIYIYYDATASDNTAYVGTPGNRTEVWPYAAAYLLADNVNDSAGTNDGTANNITYSDGADIGGGCAVFNGTSSYFGVSSITNNLPLSLMVSAYFDNPNDSTLRELCRLRYGNLNIRIRAFGDNTVGFGIYNGSSWDEVVYTVAASTWYRFVLSINSTTLYLYVDGSLYDSTSASAANSVDESWTIGAFSTRDTQFFDGRADSIFFALSLPSAAWIKADYHAQTDNLITWGVEEEAVFITAAPIKSTTQITAEVASRIEIVAAPIKSNTQITARVRMFWPHKLNGLASGNIASFYRQAVNIEDVDKINDV